MFITGTLIYNISLGFQMAAGRFPYESARNAASKVDFTHFIYSLLNRNSSCEVVSAK